MYINVPGGRAYDVSVDCGTINTLENIVWYLQRPDQTAYMVIPSNYTEYQPNDSGGLTIVNARARNEGLYHCVAGGIMGSIITNVTVLGMCRLI